MYKAQHYTEIDLEQAEEKNSSATSSPIFFSSQGAQAQRQYRQHRQVVVGNISDSNDLAHELTAQRVSALKKCTIRLNNWLKQDIQFSKENVHRLEYELITICEILIQLRKNFSGWRYAKLIQDTWVNVNIISPPKVFRNLIVHKHIEMTDPDKFEQYLELATYLATLHDYQENVRRKPLDFKDIISFEDYHQLQTVGSNALSYSPGIKSLLNNLFDDIVTYGQSLKMDNTYDHEQLTVANLSLVVSISRASEIITQLKNKDFEANISIHGSLLDSEIVPCFTRVRNAICHYSNTYQARDLVKIVAYANSHCSETCKDQSRVHLNSVNYRY